MFIIFFLLGLIIGSFLNVLVYRLNLAETLMGRSYCPHCKNQIIWYDNIPLLSIILLKFRCRNCRAKISYQYPLVELFTGIIFAAIGAKFFNQADTASWGITLYYLGISAMLIAILVYDFLYLEIPSLVLWPAIGWSVAFDLYFDWTSSGGLGSSGGEGGLGLLNMHIFSGVLAAMLAFAFFFLLVAVSKEKWMGYGDALLAILLGLILGWPQILLALFLAFATGAIYGIILIILKKKSIKSQLPFAPFLVLGTLVAIFFYAPIVKWYWGIFIF
jgi:leader peptidase (prepilin peptidase) / N-methyltransferase